MHTLVFVLRREQAQMEQTMIRARLGDAPPLRRKKYRQLEERLRRVLRPDWLHMGHLGLTLKLWVRHQRQKDGTRPVVIVLLRFLAASRC
ncbi:hypothetical protein ACOMHN_026844 [Nucella lapillus]